MPPDADNSRISPHTDHPALVLVSNFVIPRAHGFAGGCGTRRGQTRSWCVPTWSHFRARAAIRASGACPSSLPVTRLVFYQRAPRRCVHFAYHVFAGAARAATAAASTLLVARAATAAAGALNPSGAAAAARAAPDSDSEDYPPHAASAAAGPPDVAQISPITSGA